MQNFALFGASDFIATRHLKAIKDTKPPVGVTGGYHPLTPI
jgi:hypothetical protein